MYLPLSHDRMQPVPLNQSSQKITLATHGLKDNASSWAKPLMQTMASKAPQEAQQFLAVDWNPYSKNFLRCSVDGKRIGYDIGTRAADTNAKEIHLIGHSCGAFLVLGFCEGYRDKNGKARIKTTYLDPVSIYGGFFWKYGLGAFGSCADDAEAYIDTGDGVPGSNQTLANATTYDVTRARIEAGYLGSPHVWPTEYYLRQQAAKK